MTEAREVLTGLEIPWDERGNIFRLREREVEIILAALSTAGLVIEHDWRTIDSAPKDGTEFQGWIGDHAAWEPRCRVNKDGAVEIWGRVDYDEDDWAVFGLVTVTHWKPTPTGPTPTLPPGDER